MTVNSTNIEVKNKLISYSKALKIIKQVSDKHIANTVKNSTLATSTGKLLATNIKSSINVPSFNNSAMDGFAGQSEYVNHCINQNGFAKLQINGSIQAGESLVKGENIKPYLCWEIMTGAPVPECFDTIIQIENVQIIYEDGKKAIKVVTNVLKGGNIRKLGTDYKVNQIAVNKYTQIQPQHIMALSAVGIKNIGTLQRIKVAILSTGNELAKNTNSTLKSGKVHDSNQPYLKEFCQNINCDPVFLGQCKDDKKDFNKLIDTAIQKEVKIIFSTGAVSMGKYDFIPNELIQRGAKIHFYKSKIKPGKPILFAELLDGIIYFGLPGNPIAAASGMRFFATPFIRNMLGLTSEKPIMAKLQNSIKSTKGFRTFIKALASLDQNGQLCVNVLLGQNSYQSCSFAESNCWIVIPEDKEKISKGETIVIAPIIPNQIMLL